MSCRLHYSAVLLFSNGTSSDLYRTHMEKRELEDKKARVLVVLVVNYLVANENGIVILKLGRFCWVVVIIQIARGTFVNQAYKVQLSA